MVTFRSDVTVRYIDGHGSDEDICRAAKASTHGSDATNAEATKGLINYLVKHRHGSPFEHNSTTFLITAPIFVWREFMRHRVGFSYNEESARYKDLEPVFYIPDFETRGIVRTTSSARPEFITGDPRQIHRTELAHKIAYRTAWTTYSAMRKVGVASEVARSVLPVGIYSSAFVTCNARSLMNFLSLRTHHPEAAFVSYPQREIEMVAEHLEAYLKALYPLTHAAFVAHGRVAP